MVKPPLFVTLVERMQKTQANLNVTFPFWKGTQTGAKKKIGIDKKTIIISRLAPLTDSSHSKVAPTQNNKQTPREQTEQSQPEEGKAAFQLSTIFALNRNWNFAPLFARGSQLFFLFFVDTCFVAFTPIFPHPRDPGVQREPPDGCGTEAERFVLGVSPL